MSESAAEAFRSHVGIEATHIDAVSNIPESSPDLEIPEAEDDLTPETDENELVGLTELLGDEPPADEDDDSDETPVDTE